MRYLPIFFLVFMLSLVITLPEHEDTDVSIHKNAETPEENQTRQIYEECVFQCYLLATEGKEPYEAMCFLDEALQDSVTENMKRLITMHAYKMYEKYGDDGVSHETELKEEIMSVYDELLGQLKAWESKRNPTITIGYERGCTMKKIIPVLLVLLLVTISVSSAKGGIYSAFFQNAEKCELLAKAGFDAYRMLSKSHLLLVSFGNDDLRFDVFYQKKLLELKNLDYVKANPKLFTDVVIRQLLNEAIPIWEQFGDEYLVQEKKDQAVRYRTCMEYYR